MLRAGAIGAVVVILLIVGVACRAPGGTQPRDEASSADASAMAIAEPSFLSPEEALAKDLALVARDHGWTEAQANSYVRISDAIGLVAQTLAEQRPEQFVGSALAKDPSHPPTLYVKGPADDFVTDLVEASGIVIIVADDQPYSFDELEVRKQRVAQALTELGVEWGSVGFDITRGGMITATVIRQDGLPPTVEEMLRFVPADLRTSVELVLRDRPVTDFDD
jgi:hypothetical protein